MPNFAHDSSPYKPAKCIDMRHVPHRQSKSSGNYRSSRIARRTHDALDVALLVNALPFSSAVKSISKSTGLLQSAQDIAGNGRLPISASFRGSMSSVGQSKMRTDQYTSSCSLARRARLSLKEPNVITG